MFRRKPKPLFKSEVERRLAGWLTENGWKPAVSLDIHSWKPEVKDVLAWLSAAEKEFPVSDQRMLEVHKKGFAFTSEESEGVCRWFLKWYRAGPCQVLDCSGVHVKFRLPSILVWAFVISLLGDNR